MVEGTARPARHQEYIFIAGHILEVILCQNTAHTYEYIQHRERRDYIFNEKYMCDDIETRSLLDGKFILKTSYYSDPTHEVHKFNLSASKTEMFDSSGQAVAEFKNIDHHVDFFSVIQHSNGKDYMFFSIDLYGYSMMDLSNYKIYHYIPKESFDSHGETFIWTNILYCKKIIFLQ